MRKEEKEKSNTRVAVRYVAVWCGVVRCADGLLGLYHISNSALA